MAGDFAPQSLHTQPQDLPKGKAPQLSDAAIILTEELSKDECQYTLSYGFLHYGNIYMRIFKSSIV